MTGPDGYRVFEYDPQTDAWARAAYEAASGISTDPLKQTPDNLRHDRTWFVGVDALPNDSVGTIADVPLIGPWQGHVPHLPLHPAQLSIIYEGYPKQDANESDANHRFRLNRSAAHVDGLLPIGADKRRFAREFHAYILSIPLNNNAESPTVVWPGSQRIMQDALRITIAGRKPEDVDITESYQAARKQVFDTCDPVPLVLVRGQSALLHPFILHGTQKWGASHDPKGVGRMIAFFRPECQGGAAEWLATP